MMVVVGLFMHILGGYLYFRVIRRGKVGMHKFNAGYKLRRNIFIYTLIVGGLIMFLRELIIWFMP